MDPKRFYDEDHDDAVYVATSTSGLKIIVGSYEGDDPDVWLTPATARKLGNHLLTRARLAEEAAKK
jgi:hypothetical protein